LINQAEEKRLKSTHVSSYMLHGSKAANQRLKLRNSFLFSPVTKPAEKTQIELWKNYLKDSPQSQALTLILLTCLQLDFKPLEKTGNTLTHYVPELLVLEAHLQSGDCNTMQVWVHGRYSGPPASMFSAHSKMQAS